MAVIEELTEERFESGFVDRAGGVGELVDALFVDVDAGGVVSEGSEADAGDEADVSGTADNGYTRV